MIFVCLAAVGFIAVVVTVVILNRRA